MAALQFTYLKSRLGRRVVGLFVLCALLPLSIATIFLASEFDDQLTHNQEQDLDTAARGYGHALLGRLGSADDVLRALMVARGATDESVQEEVAKLLWIRSARIAKGGTLTHVAERPLPELNTRERFAVEHGDSAVVSAADEAGARETYLVRRLPSDRWLYAELQPSWLWADARDYAGDARLLVVDDHGGQLALAADETDPVPDTAPNMGAWPAPRTRTRRSEPRSRSR